jgi:Zn-dependent M16 (insulinase) family peptidase
VLNGSEKYPIRNALLKMMTRSVHTYMNAATAADFTMYPFSTTIRKDFKHLQSVYLDSVFRPLMNELDFMQEAWRMEPLNPEDPLTSKHVLKGIVLNEMKGAYSNPDAMMRRNIQQALYPSGPYGHDAGGNPLKIPDLSWKATKSFYKKNYHPNNCKMYSYGDFPLAKHLQFVTSYLDKFANKKHPEVRVIQEEERWTEPREQIVYYQENPSMKNGNKAAVALSYALTPLKNDFENFALDIICDLLVSGPNAPFYKSLTECHLGTNMLSYSGIQGHINVPFFIVGLQGVNESDKEDVVKIIEQTFERIATDGVSMERMEVALHKIELSLKHQQPKFGIMLLLVILDHWNHDNDPLALLKINSYCDQLREAITNDNQYVNKLIRKYFIDNNHRLTTTLLPKADVKKEGEKAEEELVQSRVSNFN